MKIVIDIPEEEYINIKNAINSLIENGIERASMSQLCLAVLDGIPLPKNHGRLIDADVLVDGLEDNYELCMEVNATPTIIPSESEEK